MARLNEANSRLAKEIISRYPRARSATIPLLHLAQEQDGYLTNEAMQHIGELVGATSAEVYGTATFYEMFKFEPVGRYLINICGTMSCALMGAEELIHHAEATLDVHLAAMEQCVASMGAHANLLLPVIEFFRRAQIGGAGAKSFAAFTEHIA